MRGSIRVTIAGDVSVARGDYVLYWMIAARRAAHSVALDHAIARAVDLDRPLVVLEPLRAGYPWASDRLHAFVIDGMIDNARAFAGAGVTYLPYVEPVPGRGRGLLAALARRASVVVTDEQPGFFLPAMVAAASARIDRRFEIVDGNGLLPLRASPGAFSTAMAFRRHLHKVVHPHLAALPRPSPLAKLPKVVRDGDVAGSVLRRWPSAPIDRASIASLPIDHSVAPVSYRGGSRAGARQLSRFIAERLPRYADGRNHPDDDASSGLSPYLHFGHVGAVDVIRRVWKFADWDPSKLAPRATALRDGWWGAGPAAEAFLDELVTWRELGYGFCFHRRDYARYASLPTWAKASLAKHARDKRPERYSRRELEQARTGDEIWNAAQRQLVGDGRIHNYLRMLWGKKILEWSPSSAAALATLVELNNKYAVDGRDPSSYSGILWTLGRFDRPWAPERPIFGVVRYMSSARTRDKLDLDDYVRRWSAISARDRSPDRARDRAGARRSRP